MKYRNFCLIFIAVISLSLSQKLATSPQHTTIVQGNHFYSNYQLNTTYNVEKVSTDRPIILILRKKEDNQVFDNNITISLISGDKGVQCKFVTFNGMCYLDKLSTSNMTMKLKCDHLPCQASWTLLQPSLKKLEQMQIIEELYDISESANHVIAKIICNNPDIKNFHEMVTVYSQNQYIRGNTKNIIFLLFKKQKSGHMYFKIQPAAKACAQMSIYNATQDLIPDTQLKDFILANQSSIFTISKKPADQFRIDCGFHEINKQPIKSEIILKITGQKNGVRQTITSLNIKPPIPTNSYQFSLAIPKLPIQYMNIQMDARSTNNILIFSYSLSLSQNIQIQQSQHTHFKLKKGQILDFKLIGQSGSQKSEQVFFFASKPNQVNISKKSCTKSDGCLFQVTALADTQQMLYAGKTVQGQTKGEAIFFDFQDTVTRKVKQQQTIYLRTKLKKDQVVRVVVNNPNVIIRASSQQKCPVPSEDCYEHVENSHHPFIYTPKKDLNMLFAVQGLDNCQFTISVISQGKQSIQLRDGEPFAYKLQQKESKLYFNFKIKQKIAVSFNLIAPVNQLMLIVNNGKEQPNGDDHSASSDGYVSFRKTQLDSLQFRILVQKTEHAKHKSVHFTLIATTSGANLRLDPGIAHVQSLKSREFKDFVFQFDKKDDYILNLYTPNVDKQDFKISLLTNNEDKWNGDKVQHFQIQKNSDVLNLKDISQQLCIEQGDIQCQIFIRIINNMDIQIDVTVTLLVKDSVIELKDGLWQTYAINTIATTSHFYFLPTTKNSSISILYKSSLVDIGIIYSLWKSEKQDIDPTQWPFPPYKEGVQNPYTNYQPVNHISIDTQNLKQCWPNCVILISLYKKKTNTAFQSLSPDYQGNFSIIAANKIFQLPENSRVEIMLKKGQQKYIMVDLKHALNKQVLTFFTNQIIGSYSLVANVYSQKNPRCPGTVDYDFNFGQLQTQIKLESILAKKQQNDMTDDKDQFLCILAIGYQQTKFTIQYTSAQQIIKLLTYDSFENFIVKAKVPKFYQLEASQQFQIKFTRQRGYFYAKIAVCKQEQKSQNNMQQCLEQLKSDKDRGKQILSKTYQFKQKPCPKCIVFIRIDADDQSQGVIHIQSSYSSVSLQEKDVVSDFANEGEVNKYSITALKAQQTIISVSVTQGDPQVTVTNYGDLNVTKRKSDKNSNILIVIPPEKTRQNVLGGILYDSMAYSSTFRYLVVTVKSVDPARSIAYTISYSSGERQTYLQDGMAVSYTLQPKKKTIFLYQNPNHVSHGFLTISMAKSTLLFNVNFKMYTFSDPKDEQTKVEVTPQKPPMRKNTPNPTIVFTLPNSPLVSIQLQSDVQSKITLTILHQELVILPFDQQFPFQLHKGQTINLLSDVNNAGYLLVTIRKCDQSDPDFGYTFSYDSFQKSQFQYTTNLANEPKFQFYIKAKVGTLYMQLNVTDSEGLYSIQIHYSDSKIKGQKAKAGKNGAIQYKIADSKKAAVNFTGVVCSSGSKCDRSTKYYWMAGNNLQDVYTQTVCPYSYFQTLGIASSQPLAFTEITSKPSSDGIITFDYPYSDHITYLAVKAVVGNDQVYYQPLEIITMWGTVSRAGRTNYLLLIIGGFLLFVCSLICMRRIKKSAQYEKLGDFRQEEVDY